MAARVILRAGARPLLSAALPLAALALLLATPARVSAAQPDAPSVRLASGGKVRALVIGINAYHGLPVLKGAVADAEDIADTLRASGATDVRLLTNAAASRADILREMEALRLRTKANDLVIITLAGHGSTEPERVKGSEKDGKDAVFLLADFAAKGAGTQERILDKEFNHFIRGFEDIGARVLFVADSCSGGGLARDVDPRAGELSYRAAPSYKLTDDVLQPISTPKDAMASEVSFERTLFLAAVDKQSKAPEVRVPGQAVLRGALSYAVARAFEGAADANGDGVLTGKELFDYVRQVSYQLSDQRQVVVTASAPGTDLTRESVALVTRGVRLQNAPQEAAPPVTDTGGGTVAMPVTVPVAPSLVAPIGPVQRPVGTPIRIAALDGKAARFANLAPLENPFEVVLPNQQPDLVWDPNSRDVIAAGDIIARDIDASDLPSVVDRMATVRNIKLMASHAPLTVRLLPDSKVHSRGTKMELTVDDVQDRAFFLINIAGDGTVQTLYPVGNDRPVYDKAQFRMQFAAREPFGADQVIAISAPQQIPELEQGLKRLNERRASAQLVKLLARFGVSGTRYGSVTLYTAP